MTEPPYPPLANDPKREATDSLRGYSYQILRSIAVWFDLDDGEQLILEGAEDLDRIGAGGALVEQIKDTAGSGSVTLRTASVLEAIDHYWGHVARNPGVPIRFRYLTTSPIGREQLNPFDSDMAGLTLWQQIAQRPEAEDSPRHAAAIAGFLAKQPALASPLRDFLNTASTTDVIARLIQPIEWIAGHGDTARLLEAIEAKLILFGAERGLAASDAAGAIGALHLTAWSAAISKAHKPLTRAGFLACFDGATRISVPKGDLTALIARALQLDSGEAGTVIVAGAALERQPPLPPRFFRRVALEELVGAQIADGPVVIQGATGMGKTTLAAAVAVGHDATGWLSLRELDAEAVRARLRDASAYLATNQARLCIVLDDLDTAADPRLIEAPLAELAAIQHRLGGTLLLTCAQDLPSRLSIAIGLGPTSTIRVPAFDRDEIAAFLAAEGCPAASVPTWAALIELGTSGHPQLVHARIATLQADGFPLPDPASLLATTPDILDVRNEARRLVADLPADARELLYRASLVTGRLTRARLLAIGRLKAPIAEPGNAVDLLLGPWLEYADEGEYRVSPLIRGSAEATHGLDWAKAMHGQVAWTYLVDRTLTPLDVSAVLMHSIIARSAGPLARLLPSLLSAKAEVWAQLADACGMFVIVGIGEDVEEPFDRLVDRFVFRTLQYRIAIENDPKTAAKIVDRCDREAAGIGGDFSAGFFRFLFLTQMFQQTNVLYPIADLVRYGEELVRRGDAVNESYPERARVAGVDIDDGGARPDLAAFLSRQLMLGVTSASHLTELLDAIDKLAPEPARRVLAAWAGVPEQVNLVLDRLWLTEIREADPDWPGLRDALIRAGDVAGTLGVPALRAGIAPLLVRMVDENVGDAAAALAFAARFEQELPGDPALRAATAKVHWRAGELATALAIWREALPRWLPRADNLPCVSAYRDAGIVAARLGRWDVAAEMFRAGLAMLAPGSSETWRIGLMFDIGHALMMEGRRGEAVRELARGVAELDPLEPINKTEPVLSLQKRAGALIAGLNQWFEGAIDRPTIESFAGVCSVLDPIVWDGLFPTPTDFIVLDLVRLEQAVGESLELTRHYLARLRRTRYAVLRAFVANIAFADAVERLSFGAVISDGLMQVKSFAIGLAHRESGERFPEFDDENATFTLIAGAFDFIIARIVASLFALAARGNIQEVPLAQWRADIPDGHDFAPLRARLDEIEELMFDIDDPWDAIGRKPEWLWRLLGTLAAIARQPLPPERVLICHGAWVRLLRIKPYNQYCADSVAQLVTQRWLHICDIPALLVTRRLTVPAIQAAARSTATGWDKTRAILLAATQAVERSTGESVRAQLNAED